MQDSKAYVIVTPNEACHKYLRYDQTKCPLHYQESDLNNFWLNAVFLGPLR